MIRAVIFDLDGTLIDSEILRSKAVERYVASRGLSVTEAYAHEVVFGRAWSDIVGRLRQDYPSLTEDTGRIERETVRLYEALRGRTDIRIPGSILLLKRLSERFPVAIVSGSTRGQIADAVRMMEIESRLAFVLGSEDYPRGKPDPGCFLMAARRFGVQPGECLVFEDSLAGVRAAKAAGMRCIALRRDGHGANTLGEADEIVDDLARCDLSKHGVGEA